MQCYLSEMSGRKIKWAIIDGGMQNFPSSHSFLSEDEPPRRTKVMRWSLLECRGMLSDGGMDVNKVQALCL